MNIRVHEAEKLSLEAIYRRRRFPQRYTPGDIELPASVDEAHQTLSGPATRHILEREIQQYGNQEYARLVTISVGPLYNLRQSQRYRERLNPYLNYHRPCAQSDVKIDEKGRKRVRYKICRTPLETLLALDKPAQYLREGLSINALKRVAGAIGDTDAARRMQQAKAKLLEQLRLNV